MKVLLLLQRNYSKQFSIDEWAKQTECRTIAVDLPDISNDRAREDPVGVGEWQIVGYEEIEVSEEKE